MIKDTFANVLMSLTVFLVLYGIMKSFEKKPAPQKDVTRVEVVPAYELPSIKLPDTVSFAGERVPLEDPDVRERLDRELHVNTFFHSNTIFLLKRGNRWLPEIEKELQKYGVPADFKYIAAIESDLTNVVSPREAVGFWQLLKGTAKDYDLEVNDEVDERYDPIKSTDVAAQYLLNSYEKFGNWTNAAASYNIGVRGLERNIEKQRVNNYYDLLLNSETARYIFRAIAVKLIFQDPEKFGFKLDEDQLYHMEDLKEVEVTESIDNLVDFAFEHGINYKILKRYNPWLRENSLAVRHGKTYTVLIPKSAAKEQ